MKFVAVVRYVIYYYIVIKACILKLLKVESGYNMNFISVRWT